MTRTHPMSIDTRPLGRVGAERRTRSSRRRCRRRGTAPARRGRRSRRGTTSAASSSPESSSGVTPSASCAAVEELVAVRRVARRARRGRADARRRRARRAPLRYSRSTATVRVDRVGCERARAVDALAEAGDAHAPVERARAWRRGAGPSTSATSRRTEFVPMSIAADPGHAASTARRLDAVASSCGDPPADGIVAAGEEVRRSARAGTSRPCGCRRRRRDGRGPAWPAGDRGVALGRVARRARPASASRIDGRLGGAHAAGRLEPRHRTVSSRIDEPVARRHRRAVAGEAARCG